MWDEELLLGMTTLSASWAAKLLAQAETGMDYQIASVFLRDGRRFDQVVIVGGHIAQVRGMKGIPFSAGEIAKIQITHDKWDFKCGAMIPVVRVFFSLGIESGLGRIDTLSTSR